MKACYRVEIEQEEDGRFLAEVVDLPGVMAYGETADLALARAQALALRVLADRLDHDEGPPRPRKRHLRGRLRRRVIRWRATRASRAFAALQRIGWSVKREAKGSDMVLRREGFPNFVWAFHDRDEIGPRMLARIGKRAGLTPDDLWPSSLELHWLPPWDDGGAEPRGFLGHLSSLRALFHPGS